MIGRNRRNLEGRLAKLERIVRPGRRLGVEDLDDAELLRLAGLPPDASDEQIQEVIDGEARGRQKP